MKSRQLAVIENIMINIKLIFNLCLLLTLFSSFTYAEVILRERFSHYNIQPDTVQHIKLELRKHSPVSRKDKLFHGGTEWKLSPQFSWKVEKNLCRIKDVVVYLEGIYTLPKMTNRTTSTKELIDIFDDYYQSLLIHEKGHQALWLAAGKEISNNLKSMPPHYLCEQLKSQAKTRINEIVVNYQTRNQKYDKATGHGKTQGVFISGQ